ncbi:MULTISPECIES: Spx/MgsR family RNA polymerase-binding regulatory protein [Peptoniphilus]|jgi:transcriptional regulator, spx/mgsR family|uniref:Spx/MgsR family RNA polymerase-binding regulatory protein n=1 Tax=Peptoniphilus TaxID=162289 RepID=UPI00028859C1|nr:MULTISPECIES: Spx/MgsR family RNA polymerase-binding regulatory protein [Peptoniphilus]MBS6611051.1 Spx/MgsR family RNA polymerase-binding regulatory protein [Peptoniphilus harei]MDU1044119.1 Spx/MgsR family RNA polymerase-binding regulatory protein [Peptoniphilus rhinitidis]MDU1955313.1 Spx/MgsR family RNA polymerase-binding regulatory protein [Peptoniphilus lacydonensis]MDU2109454.1 Spx/MgsR family RNA polymerase-binding regulatory protein [Peptoniphilus lacydonensis]MDU2114981.1 Spx/MgsR
MNTLIGYKKCSTCKNIEKLLEEKNISYNYREIDKDLLSKIELKNIKEKADIDIYKLFNSSGVRYRELGLKDKKKSMTDDEIYELLSTDGMLVKRPILLTDKKAFIGPQVKKYLENL